MTKDEIKVALLREAVYISDDYADVKEAVEFLLGKDDTATKTNDYEASVKLCGDKEGLTKEELESMSAQAEDFLKTGDLAKIMLVHDFHQGMADMFQTAIKERLKPMNDTDNKTK